MQVFVRSVAFINSFATWRLCVRYTLPFTILIAASFAVRGVSAADNELTAEEQSEGWLLLFNGRDLANWKNNDDKPVAAKIDDGAINVHNTGGYLLVYDEPFDNFVLKCNVKMSQPECNSGIFLRTSDLADPINTAFEVQVFEGKIDAVQDFGAIYDLVAPSKDARKGPGEWNALEIRCDGPRIAVKVNGQEVTQLNSDDYPEPGLRTDGTRHKFGNRAIKDFARKGYIGLQDHGFDVWFKNIKLKKL